MNAMFSQPPDEKYENHQNSKTLQNNPRRKRKRKFARKHKQTGVRKDLTKGKHSQFAITMSSWAESFTTAATWQLKHQIAYWKSKATALEYENKILHEIIKKNYTNCVPPNNMNVEDSNVKCEFVKSEMDQESEAEEEEENENFEVSEEFIQFLQTNAKYKEDARLERERLKAKQESDENALDLGEGHSEIQENSQEKLKELYGKDWQKIAALEMTVECNFINEIDKDSPMYWPNIPFNFNFS